jgi:hypothetical protein
VNPETKVQVRVILRAAGEFWCEASVLVAVFALLDEILRVRRLPSSSWALGVLLVVVLTFDFGVLLKLWSRK